MDETYMMPIPWVQLRNLQMRTPVRDSEPPSAWASLRLAEAIIFPGIIFTSESDFHFSVSDGNSKIRLNDVPVAHQVNHMPCNKPMLDDVLGATMHRVFSAELLKIEGFIRGEGDSPVFQKRVANDVYGQTCILVPVEYVRIDCVKRLEDSDRWECDIHVGHHVTLREQWVERTPDFFLRGNSNILDKTVISIVDRILNTDECWSYLDALRPGLPDLKTAFWDAIPDCDFKKPPPQVTFAP